MHLANAAAIQLQNFVARDGTAPDALRRIALDQLATYPNVAVRDARVQHMVESRGGFQFTTGGGSVQARRVILCTGMIDEPLPIEGFADLWGHAIFQCPYCHGWEVQQRPWGYLARDAAAARFAVLLRGWSAQVSLFTHGLFEVDASLRIELEAAAVQIHEHPVARLRREGHILRGLELASGSVIPCETLFAHPPQRQVEVVTALGLALDADGFVRVDPVKA